MSRIGKKPIELPKGVTVSVDGSNLVTVKGPKGSLTQQMPTDIKIDQEGTTVMVTRPSDEKNHRALHGLTRALLNNMVVGTSTGFQKVLEINGVGYRAQKTGRNLTMSLGFSHPVIVEAPEGIDLNVGERNTVIVSGSDKQAVGEVAAYIRSLRPPEPYKGKGIKYSDEVIRRKAGKAGKAGGKGGKK